MSTNLDRIKNLNSEKKLMLAEKLRKITQNSMAKKTVALREQNWHEWPLSFNQERLWFFDQILPGNPVYNIPGALYIRGSIDIDTLHKAIQSTVERHEILRTVFLNNKGTPVQVIQPDLKPGFVHYDLRKQHDDKNKDVKKIFKKEAKKSMNLEKGPLSHYVFIQVENEESYLIGIIHHIISDAWSVGVLIKDIFQAYEDITHQGHSCAKPLPFQHVDYIMHQRKHFTKDRKEQLLRYWKDTLSGELPVLELPLDKMRKPQNTYSGDIIERLLPLNYVSEFKAFAKKEKISLYVLFLGAFKILLSKYSGQSDIIVGSSFANRQFNDLDNQIGFFANALAIRSKIDHNLTIRQFLKQLLINVMGAQENQEMPFNILVDALRINRDANISPIFQVLFEFQEEIPEPSINHLDIKPINLHSGTAKFDLTMEVTARREGLHLLCEYNTDLFNKDTVEMMFEHYLAILEQFMDGLGKKLRNIELLNGKQKHHLLYDLNRTDSPIPVESSFSTIFEDSVKKYPNSVAVIDGHEKISYLELKRRSEGIAQKLLSLSIHNEDLVGIFTTRSIKFVSGILGVFKAGAAYVPIAPELPAERIKQMLAICRSKAILTTGEYYAKIKGIVENNAELKGINIISLEQKYSIQKKFEYPPTSSKNLCYVIFTSGSTGVPKGAMIEQKGMINHLYAKINDFQITKNDIVAQTASQSFDISVWQFLAALLVGGQVCIFDTNIVLDPHLLIEKIEKTRISFLELVPSVLDALVEEIALLKVQPEFSNLRVIIVTGEAVMPETCRKWFRLYPHIPLLNAYGPTECSDDITHYVMKECKDDLVRVPIGRPIANTQIYILDEDLNLLPKGVIGEVYASGIGVGRGYLNDPQNTAKAFLPNPFALLPGTRIYKTGDLGRWLSDGNIEYLNRRDFQIKIRGFRIELEEIEAILKTHPGVKQNVVSVRKLDNENSFLVAYWVAALTNETNSTELENYLKTRLPAYMVPTIYVQLDKMPLNQNGKIDRKNLPDPDITGTNHYVEPKTDKEKIIAEIWRDLLGLKKISVHDNFFELGGDSLQIIQMVSRARRRNIDITPELVFKNQSLKKLSENASELNSTMEEEIDIDKSFQVPRELIERWTKTHPSEKGQQFYALTPIQAGILFNQEMEKKAGININQQIISITGNIELDIFKNAWRILFQRNDSLRTSYHFDQEIPFQVVHESVEPEFEKLDFSKKNDGDRAISLEKLIIEDRERGFDVKKPPLMRLKLITLGKGRTKIIWTFHQLLADGWSTVILWQEFFKYLNDTKHRKALDPEPRAQYRDYISWLSHQKSQLSQKFWSKLLKDMPDRTPLPVSINQNNPPLKAYASIMTKVSEQTVKKLNHIAKEFHLTMNSIIQSAWSIIYSKYTGSSDIIYGINVSGRPGNLKEIEWIVGLFINTLPVRVKLDWNLSTVELGRKLQSIFMEMKEFEHTPIWDITHWTKRVRSSRDEQLFEVIVGFDNFPFDETVSKGTNQIRIDNSQVIERTGYPFVLDILPGHAMDLKITFDQRKYQQAFIQRLIENLKTLIDRIADDPSKKLIDYDIISESEHQFLKKYGSNENIKIPNKLVFQELFHEQVKKTPDHIAVQFQNKKLTYKELYKAVSYVASALHHKYHIGPESKVVIVAERSIDFMIAVLAIWKAGGVYIPLDTRNPSARYAKELKICKPDLIISEEDYLDKINIAVKNGNTKIKVTIIGLENILKEKSASNIKVNYSPAHGAYILFTSGSTGSPKGVIIEQRGMINHIFSKIDTLKISKDDVTAQLASQCFDISVWQFFAPLLTGGSVMILEPKYSLDAIELIKIIQKTKINILEIVPSQLRIILDVIKDIGIEKLNTLKWIILTGEALPVDITKKWRALFKNVQLMNAYGPTECSDDVTHYVLEEQGGSLYKSVPVGTAIVNTRTYVLDDNLSPLPVGVPGELFIGGTGVGRGYIEEPVKTAENYLPDPFSPNPGSRMYKTGDKVIIMEDGNIDFISRLDFQIKIRGLRIELGEIETALMQHPDVENAVVNAIETNRKSKQLIAYIICKKQIEDLELREWLKSLLPAYMIPSLFIVLDKFPLTKNGKLNRKEFPVPDQINSFEIPASQKPKTEIEIKMAEKWKELLNCETISLNSNFFEVGGHSLDAVRITSWIKKVFSIDLSLVEFFEEPVFSAIALKIKKLVKEEDSAGYVNSSKIRRMPRKGRLPLSSAQKRLWLLDNIDPNLPVYNLSDSIRFQGTLDSNLIEKIYQEIVRKHEVFRTSFGFEYGEPEAVISTNVIFRINHIYLKKMKADLLEKEVERIAIDLAHKPFDLNRAPLIRVDLIHIDEQNMLLVQTVHHIICDGWSMKNIIHEVVELYSKFTGTRKISDSVPKIQYLDYAYWHNQYIRSAEVKKHMTYWENILSGELADLNLPYDYYHVKNRNYKGDEISFEISPDLKRKMEVYCQKNNCTAYMFLLTIFKILLYRYTGQTDIILGTPVANRNRTEVESMIGFFVNTLALRSDLSGNPAFETVLNNSKKRIVEALNHQDAPFEKVVEAVNPVRKTNTSALFKIMFNLLISPDLSLELPDVQITTKELYTGTARFDLTLTFIKKNSQYTGVLNYSTELFKKETIRDMTSHFINLLTDVFQSGKKTPINKLQLISKDEYFHLTQERNRVPKIERNIICMHRWFERQVELTPNKTALICKNGKLTYSALNNRSNQLARKLDAYDVKPGCFVGLCCDRSTDLLVGLLAIIKAGGAYIPLDPDIPLERKKFILQDSEAKVLLTHEKYMDEFKKIKTPILRIDKDYSNESETNLDIPVKPNHPIYAIFTSGSTGKPKGVVVEHQQLFHCVQSSINAFKFDEELSYAMVSSFAADLIHTVLFPAICTGGTLHILPSEMALEPNKFAGYFERNKIDCLKITPNHMKALLQALKPANVLPKQRLIFGGEKLTLKLARKIKHLSNCLVFNEYGPTETTVAVTSRLIEDIPEQTSTGTIDIGRPFPGIQLYILDSTMTPVPVGIVGELYISGTQVSRGYLNNKEKTADSFLPNPFSDSDGKLYKTGDLVKWLPNGCIEFVSRRDHQVKIGGYRVELGEIETTLNEMDQVKDSVLITRRDKFENNKLIAYIIPKKEKLDIDAIREMLKRFLPDYMLPHAYVEIREIPLTPNGKIDLKNLPEPDLNYSKGKLRNPEGKIEKTLSEIWKQLLGIKELSTNDNFFSLGGDSMIVMHTVAMAAKKGLVISPKLIFEHQTIKELAKKIRVNTLDAAKTNHTQGIVPLTPIQHRYFSLDMDDRNHGHICFLLDIFQPLDIPKFSKAYSAAFKHHDILSARFEKESGKKWVQTISKTKINPQIECLSYNEIKEVELSIQHAVKSLNLKSGPMAKIVYYQGNGNNHDLLLFIMHHLVFDVYSIHIFMEDLFEAYFALCEKSAIRLPPKTTSYKKWSKSLNGYIDSSELKSEINYWNALSQKPIPELPVDFVSGENCWLSISNAGCSLPKSTTHRLLRKVPGTLGLKIHEALISAVCLTITEITRFPALLMELEGHGRENLFNDVDLSRTIGWFTALYPVYLEISDSGNIKQKAIHIAEQLKRIPNNGIGFGILRYLSSDQKLKRSLDKVAHPDVTVNYQGQFDSLLSKTSLVDMNSEINVQKYLWDPTFKRPRKIQILGSVFKEKLNVHIEYSKEQYKKETIIMILKNIKFYLTSIAK